MYIKLTRLDNTPIWLNASFVVTVEPRRGGGSVVVPIGDGLDYDVRESPEAVLAALAGAPVPAVVPVPPPKSLTPMPKDVSPSADPRQEAMEAVAGKQPVAEKPAAPLAEKPAEAPAAPHVETTAETSAPEPTALEPTAEKPAHKTAKTAARKPRAPRKPRKQVSPLADEQLERLRKMAPGSLRKLQNTLATQFKVEDADAAIAALAALGVLAIERDHVNWMA